MNEMEANAGYRQLVNDAILRVKNGRLNAWRAVNKEQIQLYWDLGKLIVERQQQYGWGKSVVENLAADLQKVFGGVSGFSPQNLWYMRQFYLEYQQDANLQPLVGEISWSKHIVIFSKVKDPHERLFYIHQTRDCGWTKNVLIHKIENQTYQKVLLGQHNFPEILPESVQNQAILALKDEYTFDFLELGEQHSEYELEQAIVANIRNFLIEMGGDFTFMGNQFRMEVDDKTWSVDLLLYHRGIQSLVAIDLKVTEFMPEYAGKMNFYLGVLNKKVRKPNENASIGIIICRSKTRTTVDFALQDINKPIGVATYTLSPTLPPDLQAFFPDKEEFVKRVEVVNASLNRSRASQS
jgi:predicted nuclease of restriction endonuclease-like (RecB) superfamily